MGCYRQAGTLCEAFSLIKCRKKKTPNTYCDYKRTNGGRNSTFDIVTFVCLLGGVPGGMLVNSNFNYNQPEYEMKWLIESEVMKFAENFQCACVAFVWWVNFNRSDLISILNGSFV